jgi:hypothetical protein
MAADAAAATLRVENSGTGDIAFRYQLLTDTEARFIAFTDGTFRWGGGGEDVGDVEFGRASANVLQMGTGDWFRIRGGNLQFGSSTVFDVILSRGAIDRLDLGSGDSFRVISGDIHVDDGLLILDGDGADLMSLPTDAP